MISSFGKMAIVLSLSGSYIKRNFNGLVDIILKRLQFQNKKKSYKDRNWFIKLMVYVCVWKTGTSVR